MSEWRDELAELEAELGDPSRLLCPVCRFAQPMANASCARCGADLSLIAGVLQESARHKGALYHAVLAGDTVAALGHLDACLDLTGPSPELAVLRRLVRHGTVPVEVLGDLHDDDRGDVVEPLAVYQPAGAESALTPTLAADEAAEAAAFAALYVEPEALPEEDDGEEEAGEEIYTAPPVLAPIAVMAPPPTPSPRPSRTEWIWPLLAVLATLALGVGLGRLSVLTAPVRPTVQAVQWKMAPLPSPKP
jgi:hypothetical protein